MNYSTYRASLDIHASGSQAVLHAKKGETKRRILITLTERGKPYLISSDCTAVFTATKPDGNIIYNGCAIDNNIICYNFTEQTTAAEGKLYCEIRLYGADNALIISPGFDLIVDAAVYEDGDVIESGTEVSALTALVSETTTLISTVNTKLENGEFNGPKGEAGGFYTPAVTQPDENTLRVAFTPSKEDMPAVEDADITLPSGGSGSVAVDSTLTESGQAADAKATGDAIRSLSEEIANKSGADYTFLNGLKYYACGDSIVDIQGTLTAPETFGDSGYTSDLQSRNITDITVEGYVTAIEQRYGLVATNCGNSGHTLVQDYASLAAKDYSDVALVTIAYGCNDARTNVPLGTVNSTDVTTFAGALNQLLRKIYTDNPECRVIVLTPIQRLYVSDFGIGTANANGNYLVDFVDMCKKVAAKRSSKCIDMYRDCGINQTNLYYYTVEGVHPVNQGFARMKGAIIPVLDNMFALEYEPFGTMTNTGETEPDEPDAGGDSGGDTPPEEEPGATVVDLVSMMTNAGANVDGYGTGSTWSDYRHAVYHPIPGKTYTVTSFIGSTHTDTRALCSYSVLNEDGSIAEGGLFGTKSFIENATTGDNVPVKKYQIVFTTDVDWDENKVVNIGCIVDAVSMVEMTYI